MHRRRRHERKKQRAPVHEAAVKDDWADEVRAKLEQELGPLDEKLWDKLNDSITDYWLQTEPDPAAVNKQLAAIEGAARKLHAMLTKAPPSLNVSHLESELEFLVDFLDASKNKVGRPPLPPSWKRLMLGLADVYEEARREKKKKAGVSFKNGKYYGPFVRVATIIDQEMAALTGVPPRTNSEIGSALKPLIKARGASAKG
jgi:hypothetical protein